MFRHQILVQNTSKTPEKSISDRIMKIKATKTTKTTLFEKSKNLQKSQKSRFWPKFKTKIKCFKLFKNMLYGQKWVPEMFQSRFAPGFDIFTHLEAILRKFKKIDFFQIFHLWVHQKSAGRNFYGSRNFEETSKIRLEYQNLFQNKNADLNST